VTGFLDPVGGVPVGTLAIEALPAPVTIIAWNTRNRGTRTGGEHDYPDDRFSAMSGKRASIVG
jgi:hypothetical protein